MTPHDPAAEALEACRTDRHGLAPETAPCGGIRRPCGTWRHVEHGRRVSGVSR